MLVLLPVPCFDMLPAVGMVDKPGRLGELRDVVLRWGRTCSTPARCDATSSLTSAVSCAKKGQERKLSGCDRNEKRREYGGL